MRHLGYALLFTALLATPVISSGQEDGAERESPAIRREMDSVFSTYRELQGFMLSRSGFVDEKNKSTIEALLSGLSERFHTVQSIKARHENDPSFVANLNSMRELLADAKSRFADGRKDYALWRLRYAADLCVGCHTRYEVNVDFTPPAEYLGQRNAYEQGQYYMATRQFEKAHDAFVLAAASPQADMQRIDALRRLLVIYTRVNPDPARAVRELTRLRAKLRLGDFEQEELASWLSSLRRWQNEGRFQLDPVRQAGHLIEQARVIRQSTKQAGSVELLRASSILHRLLEETPDKGRERSVILYLLGLSYKELPFSFGEDLPEVMFEESIRSYPASDLAAKAYREYHESVTIGFTGSGGTEIPEEINRSLRELYDLAHQKPAPGA